MRVLVPGSEGKDIRRWQLFLMGQGLAPQAVSGAFDEPTVQATSRQDKDIVEARYRAVVNARRTRK
jgi:hypothetical protein